MTRYLLTLILGMVISGTRAEVQTQKLVLLFETDKHLLTETAEDQLNDFICQLDLTTDYEIEIFGHTDNVGNLDYNEALAEKRSLSVRKHLMLAGVSERLIRSSSFGERRPDKPNTNENFRNLNRRVEVVLTVYSFENVMELEQMLSREGENKFTVNPSEPSVIQGRQGVSMLIEPNSFVNAEGKPVTEPVTITLTEALAFEDYIGHNLATLSGDRMLVSGGMFNISAQTSGGEEVNMAQGKTITTAVTAPQAERGMQLFTSNSGSDWDLTDTKVTSGLELDMPPYPVLNYRSYQLPVYKRDLSKRPVNPEPRSRPRPPKAPDPLDYEPEISWYQLPFASIIKKNAHERYLLVMEQYEKKQNLYERRYELYIEHNRDIPEKKRKYKKGLAQWNRQCKEDSIALFSSSEYMDLKNKNLLLARHAAANHKKKVEEWKALRREKLGKLTAKMDSMGVTNEELVNTYMFAMNEMSWINIDRFYKMDPTDLREVTLKDIDQSDEKVFVVFKDLNSMLPMIRKEKNPRYFERNRFPLKEKAALLAYKVVDGKTMVYYENLEPRRSKYTMEYKPYTFRELQQLLDDLQG